MNPHDQAKLDAIERDRRRREDELLLALLLLCDDARRDTTFAVKHGFPYSGVITRDLQPARGAYARTMAYSFRDGYRRAALLTQTNVPRGPQFKDWLDGEVGTVNALAMQFDPQARASVDAMIAALILAVDDEIQQPGGRAAKAIVRDAFDSAGYSRTSTRALDVGAERTVIGAHNSGIFAASHYLSEKVTGLRHVSVIDDRTTDRCRERDGLMLPIDDPYWITGGVPPLHWGCRSALIPIVGEFSPSDWRPSIPPAPGFGEASAVFIQRLKGGLAA